MLVYNLMGFYLKFWMNVHIAISLPRHIHGRVLHYIWYCRFVQFRLSRNGATQLVALPGGGGVLLEKGRGQVDPRMDPCDGLRLYLRRL